MRSIARQKLQVAIVDIFFISHVIRARLHSAYDLQRSNRNVSIKRASSDRATVQWCRLCHVEQVDQLLTDLEENVGNWAREVKPLMRYDKKTSIVVISVSCCPTFWQLLANIYYRPPPHVSHHPIQHIYVMVVSQSPSL